MTGRVDRWSDTSRKWIPILVFLILIPVTLHLWGGMIWWFFESEMDLWEFIGSWNLLIIETSTP